MRLCDQELRAMNSPLRRFLHRRIEFPLFRLVGLQVEGRDILEVGCGTGYGAELLVTLGPKSYLGVDLMPEMIELAKSRRLPGCEFVVGDAADLGYLANESKDVVVIFDTLHHIPKWREVIDDCYRVLRVGGKMFVEEPNATVIRLWDSIFHWGHPREALFSNRELESHLSQIGLTIKRRLRIFPFGIYCLQKH